MSEVIDNKANRIRVLKDIIKHLHAGIPPSKYSDKCGKSSGRPTLLKSWPWNKS